VTLKMRPPSIPGPEHFELVTASIPELGNGQILVRNLFLSADPAMRGWLSGEANYSQPVPLGAVMRAPAVGRVEQSRHPNFRPGDAVYGMFGWQDYAAVDAGAVLWTITDTDTDLPLSTSLGVLGLPGLTAYFGLLDIGEPEPGETVVVSTAAGAVGSCAGQIAKIRGCRTVGIAGGAEKVRVCREEFRYDAAVDYKTGNLEERLTAACPDGVDVYFDNTAGPISDMVLKHLNIHARVVICGTQAIASWAPVPQGPRVERHLLVKRARMQGFLIFDYAERYQSARCELARWVRAGEIRYREDVLEGLEQAPGSVAGLYRGENIGKRVIRIAY
jgi:NADPH-dependent curcumin reductase CurA